MHHPCRFLFLIVALFALPRGLRAQAGELLNGDFNQPALLGPGQTAPAAGQYKLIITDSSHAEFTTAISGIPGWTYALPGWDGAYVGSWSDHGLCRPTQFSNSDGTTAAFINNWERTLSQVAATPLTADTRITATFDFGTLGNGTEGRAGTFYLIAGTMDAANLDWLASDASILTSLTVANTAWAGLTPNYTQMDGAWSTYTLSYTVTDLDPFIGRPLTIAFRTLNGSAGSTSWDNISVSVLAIPEPGTTTLWGAGLLALGWMRWRRKA